MVMKRLYRLCILYFKTAFSCMGRALMILAAILAIAALLLWGFTRNTGDGLSIAKIGFVSEDDSSEMDLLYKFVRQMPAIKGTCDIDTYSFDEAMDLLKSGELQMVMVVPKDFMDKAEHMQDTTLKLYVPKDGVLANDRIYALLNSVESLMVTTESAIISMYEGMNYYSYNTTVFDMENALTELYIKEFLSRDKNFDIEYLSAYGSFDPLVFHGLSIILLVTSLMGMFMFRGYSSNIVETERILMREPKERIVLTFGKIICFSFPYFVFSSVLYVLFYFLTGLMDYEIYLSATVFFVLFLISILFSSFVHAFNCITENREGREALYALATVFLWILSGALSGNYFMPAFLRPVLNILPQASCLYGLLGAASDSINSSITVILIYIILFFVISIIFVLGLPDVIGLSDKAVIRNSYVKEGKVNWAYLKLRQNLLNPLFYVEAIIIILLITTIHFSVLKTTDTNRVVFSDSCQVKELIGDNLAFEYDFAEGEAIKDEVIKGKALAGIEEKDGEITLYAPAGSYSATVIKEMIFPNILKENSSKMLGDYLTEIGTGRGESYDYVIKINEKLLDEYKLSIFEINETDVPVNQKERADIVLIASIVLIIIACVISCTYELKTHKGFFMAHTACKKRILLLESGLIRGALLGAVVVITILLL